MIRRSKRDPRMFVMDIPAIDLPKIDPKPASVPGADGLTMDDVMSFLGEEYIKAYTPKPKPQPRTIDDEWVV